MSATACNTCHELITFVLNANGRWRPVDVTYTVVELDGDELLAVQEDGAWRQTSGKTLRVYRAHSCPENPAWNQGAARTRQITDDEDVDKETGEVREPKLDVRARQREFALRSYQYTPSTLVMGCVECAAEAGEPCTGTRGEYLHQPHQIRRAMTAFADDEPWPPRRNQKGYKAMHEFLADYADIFALPEGATP